MVKPVLPRLTATVTAMPGLRDLQTKADSGKPDIAIAVIAEEAGTGGKLRLRSPNRYLMHIMHSKSSAFCCNFLKKVILRISEQPHQEGIAMIQATSCGGVVIFRGKILVLYKNYKNKYEGWVYRKEP